MFGPKYVWFLISGRNQDNWWKVKSPLVDCTPEQVRKGLSNNIGTGELKLSPLPGTTIHGKVSVREYNSLYYRLRLIWSLLGIGFTAVVGGVGGMGGGGVGVGGSTVETFLLPYRVFPAAPPFPGFLFLTLKHYCVILLYFSRFLHFLYSYLLLFPLPPPSPLPLPILPVSHPMASPTALVATHKLQTLCAIFVILTHNQSTSTLDENGNTV